MSNRFVWTLEIEVDEDLVADGIDLTPQRAQRMLETAFPYGRMGGLTATVLLAPDPKAIRKTQGYDDAE